MKIKIVWYLSWILMWLTIGAGLTYHVMSKKENISYGKGFDAGRKAQVDENKEYGVMDGEGNWKSKYGLAR